MTDQCQYHYNGITASNNPYALWYLMRYNCLNNRSADIYKLSVPIKSCGCL